MLHSVTPPPGFSCTEDELTSVLLEPPGMIRNAKLLATLYGEFALMVVLFGVSDVEFEADIWRP